MLLGEGFELLDGVFEIGPSNPYTSPEISYEYYSPVSASSSILRTSTSTSFYIDPSILLMVLRFTPNYKNSDKSRSTLTLKN